MRNFIVEHLVCVTDNCNSLLDVECMRSVKDDCVEGFLRCNKHGVSYPIINGVAILVNDLTNYMSQRTRVLGKWLLECKSDFMKNFLREKSKNMQNILQNKYEIGGAWFEPYLYMHSSKKKVDKHFAQIMDESFDNFYMHIINLILDRFSSSKMCLDLGCATGTATHRLAKKLDHVFGVDQSYSFVGEARKQNKNGNAEFLVADSLKLPFKKGKFDLVTSFNMLDLVNPEELTNNVSSLLQPNGNLVLTDPYDFRDEKGDPRISYDSKSIRKLLTDKKFIIDKKTCNELFLPWALRINRRAYLLYFTDLIMARKSI